MFRHHAAWVAERFETGKLANRMLIIAICIYDIVYTSHFFVKMMSHGYDKKPKLYLDRMLIQLAIGS